MIAVIAVELSAREKEIMARLDEAARAANGGAGNER